MSAPSVNYSDVLCDDLGICVICVKQASKYTCPRCNIRYCSLSCYRSEKHSKCSEEFYKDCVVEELSHSTASDSDREKVLEILQREQDARDEDTEDVGDADDDTNIEERLKGLDLDKDVSEVWSRLTEQEKCEFSQMLNDGRLGNLVEVWTPWWTKDSQPDDAEASSKGNSKKPSVMKNIPDIMNLLPNTKPSSDLRYGIINVLCSYVFVTRLHNGGHLDCPLDCTQDLLSMCHVLGEGKNCTSTGNAVHTCLGALQQNASKWKVTAEMQVQMLEDVDVILSGPGAVFPLSSLLAALSDVIALVRRAYTECQSGKRSPEQKALKKTLFRAEKKILFFLAYVERYGMAVRDLVPDLRLELDVLKAEVTEVSETKKKLEACWGGSVPQPEKTLIQELT